MNNKITYHREGDYLIPNLAVKGTEEKVVLGKYGRARLKYIKENKRGLYIELMMNGALSSYLKGIDKRCNRIVNITVREMAKENNVDEKIKRTDQLEWVGLTNNFKNVAEEIAEKILKNVPNNNKKYVQKQLDQLDKNFMDYLYYWNEKYYRNGFVDGSQLVMGCFEE